VLETLGHARSHLTFWNEKERAMIGGDLVLANVSSNPIIEPPANPADERPKSLLEYNRSLRRIQDLPVELIYSGHGDEVRNARELIKKRLEQQHDRAMKVLAMMENQPRTIFEMTRLLFPSMYEKELGLTLSETIGQADYLVAEGYAVETRDEGSGVLYYRKA
jgi:glyoxylase-like metal-dependent hydrolase (beta-lactamase superfamily II)